MSKYCPTCMGEFTDDQKTCPQHEKPLVSTKPSATELVDFYAAAGIIEAEIIIDLLTDHGILAHEITEGISQLPVSSDTQFIISVIKGSLVEARKILTDARADGVISENGSFL